MRIELTTIDDLSREEWNKVMLNNTYLTVLNYDSLCLFWEHFKGETDPTLPRIGGIVDAVIVRLFRENELTAIIPLVLVDRMYKFLKVRSIEFLTQQLGGPYLGVIGEEIDEKVWGLIRKKLIESFKFDLFQLTYISDYSFCEGNIYYQGVCPLVNLSNFEDFEAYSKSKYDGKFKYNLRSRLKKFIADGGKLEVLTFNELSSSDLEEMRSVSATKEIDGKQDVLKDEKFWKYLHQNIMLYPNKVILARLQGRIVAFQYSIYLNNFRLYVNLAYDRKYKKYGLGNLIDNYEIETENFEHVSLVSMGPGLDVYKKKFATAYQPIYSYLSASNTIKGKLVEKYLKRKFKKIDLYWQNQFSELNVIDIEKVISLAFNKNQ